MKAIVLLFAACFSIAFAHAQNMDRCATDDVVQMTEEQYPGYQRALDATFARAKAYAQNHFAANKKANFDTIYRVPVVVHVVYNTAAQNIPDSLVYNQIEVLNQDFRRLNADTGDTRSVFKPVAADAGIEFYLARRDPNGIPTTGITRTPTSENNFAISLFDPSSTDRVKSSSTGGVDAWDPASYLNIWVCNLEDPQFPLGQVLGFAYPPLCAPNWPQGSAPADTSVWGVVVHFPVFGRNNPQGGGQFSIADRGRTAVHEIGHYLGLRHIWGDGPTSSFGIPDCSADDGIDDTPNAGLSAQQICNFNNNTCTDTPTDLPDMIENYMDYAEESCMNMFSQGQVDIMRAMLATCRSSVAGFYLPNGDNSANVDDFSFGPFDTISVNPGDVVDINDGQSTITVGSQGGILYNSGDSVYVVTEDGTFTVSTGGPNIDIQADGTVNVGDVGSSVEFVENSLVRLYPNPAKNILNIDLGELKQVQSIEMFDAVGRVVYVKSGGFDSNLLSIDVASFTAGLYSVRVTTNENFVIAKALLQ